MVTFSSKNIRIEVTISIYIAGEAERLRQDNEKLRYRINILRRATERELEAGGTAEGDKRLQCWRYDCLSQFREGDRHQQL